MSSIRLFSAAALVCLALCATVAAYSQPYSIQATYSFDDGTASDGSGNGHNGILFGSPVFEEGIVGQGIRFDGIDDYVEIPNAPQLVKPTVSISFWIRIDEVPASDQTILEKISNQIGYAAWIKASTGAVVFGIWGDQGETEEIESPFPVMPGVWTSVTAVYSTTGLGLYMHGEMTSTLTTTSISIAQDGPIIFGKGEMYNPYTGMLDQVVVAEGEPAIDIACGEALKIWDPITENCVATFTDVAEELGIDDPEHRHFGITVVDANNDGWVDIYYPNGLDDPTKSLPPSGICPDSLQIGEPDPENYNTFYLNNGDGTFTADIAQSAGVDDWWNAMRHVWGDYNNDGLRDLFSHNFVKSTLYKNVSISPMQFVDANAETGLELCLTRGTGASWVDLNNDGWLDLYGCEYDAERNAVDHVNKMYINNGDETFTDITVEAGLTLPDNPMGVAFADIDNDGDQDFFVTNSHEPPLGAPSRLYRHEGPDPFSGLPSFTDIGAGAGVDITGGIGRGFGAAWGDYNNDGRLDLLYSREKDSRLFRNDGVNGNDVTVFTDVTGVGGLDFSGHTHQDGNFADLDNNGFLDVLMADIAGENQVFLNHGDGTWSEIALVVGMDQVDYASEGVAPADIDNDGDLDVVWYNHTLGDPNTLYINDERGNNWVQFRLTGTTSNRDAVGARISVEAEIEPGNIATQIREITGGTGFFADVPRIQTFGLGKASEIISAKIHWPSGQLQILSPPEINQRHDVDEPPLTSVDGEAGELVPDQFALRQNYPNPFNPSTRIDYHLPEAGKVSLKVFNVLGQEVATLVNGIQGAGLKSVRFEADYLPSGVYVYRLEASGVSSSVAFVSTRKMILVK